MLALSTLSLTGLPLPLRERAGGEGRNSNGPRPAEIVLCENNTGPSPQPSPWEAEGAEHVAANPAYFATLDIIIDPQGKPMGAYQFELTSPHAGFTVVGVEAGEHPAFNHGRPPYFDRTAQQQNTDKLIVAQYALPDLAADKLPTGPVRVATIHVMLQGNPHDEPDLTIRLITAGDAEGNKIDAAPSYKFRNPERPE